ncbi:MULTISPECIES: DoxX family protein [unclassified Leisingera]|uniref:DoxX family protein n=1 Tax=unclassified Leisingera TaxID=2614906 RepID=UPI0021A759C0|nr:MULTISPECIES: DoxX family protein [unclassified Leisingera]UWQ30058.1 DoxX family protein [Leisingera sp. M523]UWQ76227.1 DoxX family protein [Leisingera sp. M658]
MHALVSIHNAIFSQIERVGDWLLPLAARFVFAAVLLVYFWKSALTKFGDGFFGFLFPSDGAYIQIFPKFIESVGYDFDQLTIFHWAFAFAGMWAELILPLLIVIGLFTRLASLGMIGFVAVQSFTDVYVAQHSQWGNWFDNIAEFDPAIKSVGLADIRVFWVFVLAILVIKGGGALSADAILRRRAGPVTA